MIDDNSSSASEWEAEYLNKVLSHPYDVTTEGPCPYCGALSECDHWDGLGWSKDLGVG